MNVTIKPSVAKGNITAPPSKSVAHRMLICSALANEESVISGISESEDILATIDCLKSLGADITVRENTAYVKGIPNYVSESTNFYCRESGSTLRFLIPLSLLYCKKSVFYGSNRLLSRGIGIYKDIFTDKKIQISEFSDRIEAKGTLSGGNYYVPGNVSSQFISGLLFALPLLNGESKITVIPPIESKPYIDLTVDILQKFGVKLYCRGNDFFIKPQKYMGQNLSVEGDWSNSAFYFALNSLGSFVNVSGLNKKSLQGDKIVLDYIKKLETENSTIDLSACPDLAPVLFALSAAKNGALFTGTKRLKIKESDRGSAMKTELLKFGVKAETGDNFVKIPKGTLTPPSQTLDSHNDHRIVMALTLLACITGGTIAGFEAINKSYPDFFDIITSLGLEAKYDA